MRISYNAPATLTFALISTAVLLLDMLFGGTVTASIFSVGATMDTSRPLDYVRLVAHIGGHADWNHLMSNFAFILLLGPILEEKYGSLNLVTMMLITALITGVLNVLFLTTGLMGASGIVFMMILLVSFTNYRKGEIPLTFILIVALYLTREIMAAMQTDGISQFAHILGGICGSMFGFLKPGRSD